MYKNLTVRSKILLQFAVVCAIAILAVTASTIFSYRQTAIENAITENSIIANLIAPYLSKPLTEKDKHTLHFRLHEIHVTPFLQAACVLDNQNILIQEYNKSSENKITWPKQGNQKYKIENDNLYTFQPIMYQNKWVGTLNLSYSLKGVNDQLTENTIYITLSGVIALFASLLIATWFQGTITKPIQELHHVAKSVSNSNTYNTRAIKYYNDEIGSLTTVFNQMLDKIETREEELKKSSQSLERRVANRTSQLKKSNDQAIQNAKALQQKESRLTAIIETAADGIVIINNLAKVQHANANAQITLTSNDHTKIENQCFYKLMNIPTEIKNKYNSFNDFLASDHGKNFKQGKEITLKKSLPVEIIISVFEQDGSPTFTALIKDISERKKQENEKEILHKQLLDITRQAGKAEVATGVLHNVGNVLNSVNTSADQASQKIQNMNIKDFDSITKLIEQNKENLATYFDQDTKGKLIPEYLIKYTTHIKEMEDVALTELRLLKKNVDHIKTIVSKQQQFATVSGQIESIPAVELVKDAIQIVHNELLTLNIQIQEIYNTKENISVDRHAIIQILVNLINNAKHAINDHNCPERNITITVDQGTDASVNIIVIDTGIGISETNLKKLFQHGFTTKPKGHGFGLHSCAIGAKIFGGSLTATSQGINKGAKFILNAPKTSTSQTQNV